MSRAEIVETVVIFAALLALWPKVLGFDALWYDYGVLTAALLAMVGVLAIRLRRMNAAFREARRVVESRSAGRDGAASPFPPPTDSDHESRN